MSYGHEPHDPLPDCDCGDCARHERDRLRTENAHLRETLQGIADADWRKWEELASPDEFVRWAKARAQHALTV